MDGHHSTLSERELAIPKTLQCFTGYNTPELSKHRKRSHENLYATKLSAGAMHKSAFKPAGFRNHQLQPIIDKHVLEYADFLASKAKHQALHHAVSHSSNVEQLSFS